jgi:hypothetical protein
MLSHPFMKTSMLLVTGFTLAVSIFHLLSTFMMASAIIYFVNIYYRAKEKNKIDRKLAQLTN